jgi:SnoaL-like domain
VLQNWLSVFEGVPDFSSELVASAVNGETEWGESYWRGHHTDGSAFAMRGVTIFVVRDGLVVEGAFVHGARRSGRWRHRRCCRGAVQAPE